jgi:hypothetical protein
MGFTFSLKLEPIFRCRATLRKRLAYLHRNRGAGKSRLH